MADVSTALRIPGVELVAACDVFDGRLDAARERYGAGLFTTRNYNEVLAREDIDAVIVGTPDHWHQPISIAALRAGKAAYCEKPMVHTIAEGHDLVRAQEESGSVFQVGSQGMSSLATRRPRSCTSPARSASSTTPRASGRATIRSGHGNTPFRPTRPRRRSTGSASWVRHPTAPTTRSASSAGATTATTGPGSRAISSSTSSRASTSW